jgi:YD repeat-containing protein
LTTATLPQGDNLAYAYDGDGNRKQESRNGAAVNYGYSPASNRLLGLTGAIAKSFAYDAAGNLTANGNSTFTYDGRGRLTQASTGHSYSFNGMGQRVAKSGPGVVSGTLYFVYDEQGHCWASTTRRGTARQEIIYLGDTPVASMRASASGATVIYPIYSDHLDTPRVITNQANQKVWEWKIDTFGASAANEDPSGWESSRSICGSRASITTRRRDCTTTTSGLRSEHRAVYRERSDWVALVE